MGTKYMEIYESFLSAVTDDRFAVMSEEELMTDLLPLLKIGRASCRERV